MINLSRIQIENMNNGTSDVEPQKISLTVVSEMNEEREFWRFHIQEEDKLMTIFTPLEKIHGGTSHYLFFSPYYCTRSFSYSSSQHSQSHSTSITHTYMVGKCVLKYENIKGIHFLDRNKTPSSYGMVYDDLISLCGIITRCEDL